MRNNYASRSGGVFVDVKGVSSSRFHVLFCGVAGFGGFPSLRIGGGGNVNPRMATTSGD